MIVFEFMSTVCKMHNYKNNIIRRIKKLSLSFEFLRQRSLSQINKPRRSDEKHVFYDAQDIVFYETYLIFTRSMFFITQIYFLERRHLLCTATHQITIWFKSGVKHPAQFWLFGILLDMGPIAVLIYFLHSTPPHNFSKHAWTKPFVVIWWIPSDCIDCSRKSQ